MPRLIHTLTTLFGLAAAAGASADFSPAALSLQSAAQGDQPAAGADAPQPAATRFHFLQKNSEWLSLGVSVADDFDNFEEVQIYGSYSRFIEDRVEVIGELSVRHFNQFGNNAVGVNPAIVFRYHWWQSDDLAWTAYADIGIGCMLSTDDVPEDGSSFNFTPRAGVGITHDLGNNTRLLVGLRWSHISNARLWGDDDNPGTDAPMLHVGVIWAF